MDPSLLSSADERFDATFHTNVLVNSSGHCQYLPPGKHHSLGPPHLDNVGEVGVPSGAPRGSSWLCALGILSYHTCLLLLPSSPPCPHVFPECGNAIFLVFCLGIMAQAVFANT